MTTERPRPPRRGSFADLFKLPLVSILSPAPTSSPSPPIESALQPETDAKSPGAAEGPQGPCSHCGHGGFHSPTGLSGVIGATNAGNAVEGGQHVAVDDHSYRRGAVGGRQAAAHGRARSNAISIHPRSGEFIQMHNFGAMSDAATCMNLASSESLPALPSETRAVTPTTTMPTVPCSCRGCHPDPTSSLVTPISSAAHLLNLTTSANLPTLTFKSTPTSTATSTTSIASLATPLDRSLVLLSPVESRDSILQTGHRVVLQHSAEEGPKLVEYDAEGKVHQVWNLAHETPRSAQTEPTTPNATFPSGGPSAQSSQSSDDGVVYMTKKSDGHRQSALPDNSSTVASTTSQVWTELSQDSITTDNTVHSRRRRVVPTEGSLIPAVKSEGDDEQHYVPSNFSDHIKDRSTARQLADIFNKASALHLAATRLIAQYAQRKKEHTSSWSEELKREWRRESARVKEEGNRMERESREWFAVGQAVIDAAVNAQR